MTALADSRNTPKYESDIVLSFPVKASVKIYKGSLVVLDAGYAKPGATATGLVAVGRAKATVDNSSGSNGDLTIEVEPGTYRWANGDSIAQAQVGSIAYVVDDQTVSKAGTGKSIAGTIIEVDSYGVYVHTEASSGDESLRTDLASTATGAGAALVGIYDNAGIYTATTVEAALAEVKVLADAGMPVLKKTVTVGHADLTDAVNGEAQAINIGTALPANSRIVGVALKLATPFTGGGVSSVALDVGTSGDANALIAASDVLAAAVDGQASTCPSGIAPHKHFAAGGQLLATFTPDGAKSLNDLTAGSITVDVLYTVLA